ncbi:glycosyltransferase family 2 protein [Microbacterium ureisolvens]|uniref:glycosyltransferase family 2 protein n=1 Tax=Microbacterium ureisolvens TaxID=2781186 RepID=UPI003641992D
MTVKASDTMPADDRDGAKTARAANVLPRVSVVIPCHNYAAFLDDAIGSALSQHGVAVDVTVVDDASTDDSLLIAQQWAQRDDRVTVVAHEVNKGHIATFNEALGSATAPYVVKLDPDDVLPPGSLRRSADVLDAHSDVVFVYGHVVSFQGSIPSMPRAVGRRRVKLWSGRRWLWLRVLRTRNVIYQPEVMIRASALEVAGGHRPEVPAASDLNLWLRLATLGSVARLGGVVQGLYRKHPGSMQHTIHAGKLVDFRARRDAFEAFFAEAGDSLPDRARLMAASRRALSRDALRLAFEELEDGRPVGDYLEDALALDPRVRRTLAWRNSTRRMQDPSYNGLPVRLERLKRDLDGRVRWRVWRRYGI